jgi:HNH endonuclease
MNTYVIDPSDAFWSKVDRSGMCWVWTAAKYFHGYGSYVIKQKRYVAHRFSYALFNGEIPYGLLVCHKCDNPPCVNPDHLFLGTYQDNHDDMTRKGRRVTHRGETHPSAKLTAAQVHEIRSRYKQGNGTELGNEFGVKSSAISAIITGQSWKSLSEVCK